MVCYNEVPKSGKSFQPIRLKSWQIRHSRVSGQGWLLQTSTVLLCPSYTGVPASRTSLLGYQRHLWRVILPLGNCWHSPPDPVSKSRMSVSSWLVQKKDPTCDQRMYPFNYRPGRRTRHRPRIDLRVVGVYQSPYCIVIELISAERTPSRL